MSKPSAVRRNGSWRFTYHASPKQPDRVRRADGPELEHARRPPGSLDELLLVRQLVADRRPEARRAGGDPEREQLVGVGDDVRGPDEEDAVAAHVTDDDRTSGRERLGHGA